MRTRLPTLEFQLVDSLLDFYGVGFEVSLGDREACMAELFLNYHEIRAIPPQRVGVGSP